MACSVFKTFVEIVESHPFWYSKGKRETLVIFRTCTDSYFEETPHMERNPRPKARLGKFRPKPGRVLSKRTNRNEPKQPSQTKLHQSKTSQTKPVQE